MHTIGKNRSITAEEIMFALRGGYYRILRVLRINFHIWFDNRVRAEGRHIGPGRSYIGYMVILPYA